MKTISIFRTHHPLRTFPLIVLLAVILSACDGFGNIIQQKSICSITPDPVITGYKAEFTEFTEGKLNAIINEIYKQHNANYGISATGGRLEYLSGGLYFESDMPGIYEIQMYSNRDTNLCTIQIEVLDNQFDAFAAPARILPGTDTEIIVEWGGGLLGNVSAAGPITFSIEQFNPDPTYRGKESPVHIPILGLTETGSFNIRLDFPDSPNSAALTKEVTIEVLDYFAVASASPGVVIPGGTVQLDVEVQGGVAPYTYAWDLVGDTTSPTDIPNPLVTPFASTTYTVTVTDAEDNQVSDSVTVDVVDPTPTPTPLPQFSFTHLFCGPGPDQLTLRFKASQPILDGSAYRALISLPTGNVSFTCVADASIAPDSLFCVGPGWVGGTLRGIELVNSSTSETLVAVQTSLITCGPTATSTKPAAHDNNSLPGPSASATPTSTPEPSATPTEIEGPSATPTEFGDGPTATEFGDGPTATPTEFGDGPTATPTPLE